MKAPKISSALAPLFIPEPFERTAFALDLFAGYSRKLKARQYVYKRERYILWQKFELDPLIQKFNCRVEKQPVPLKGGDAALLAPDAITLDTSGVICAHAIFGIVENQNEADSEKHSREQSKEDVDWPRWTQSLDIAFRSWSIQEIGENATERIALTRLLRFASVAGWSSNLTLREKIVDELVGSSFLTLRDLLGRVVDRQDILLPEVAELLIAGKIFSDLAFAPLSLNTRLTVRDQLFKSR